MEDKIVCVYSKFGKCKKEDCKYYHPKEICCDKSCDIHNCLKKHPRFCRYFWGFNACKHDEMSENCKFYHSKDNAISGVSDFQEVIDQCNSNYEGIQILQEQINDITELDDIQELKRELDSTKKEMINMKEDVTSLKSELLTTKNELSRLKRFYDNQEQIVAVMKDQIKTLELDMLDRQRRIENDVMDASVQGVDDLNDIILHCDDNMQTDNTLQEEAPRQETKRLSLGGDDKKISKIENLEDEISKIKCFIKKKERMTTKATSECKMKLLALKNKMRHKLINKNEKVLFGILEKLYDTSKKLSNSTFRKVMLNDIQKFEDICKKEKSKL